MTGEASTRPPRTAILIPARYASTRFPGKPLAPLTGADGTIKPLIRRSWEAAGRVAGTPDIFVVTDDERIRDAAEGFGAAVLMTPASCANGTERCAAALDRIDPAIDIIVNLQGDAPLSPPSFVDAVIGALVADPDLPMATPAVRCSTALYGRLLGEQQAGRVGGTTVVAANSGDALYFSKRVIPYVPKDRAAEGVLPVFLHVGVYAYRRAALARYAALPVCELETLEGLEQLRFLDAGIRVGVVEVATKEQDFWELNNPADTPVIEAMLAARGIS